MGRRNRNGWRNDKAKAQTQGGRVAGDIAKLRIRDKKRGRREIRRAA
jgi:hypothetical protein